jgi:hypothetical protein
MCQSKDESRFKMTSGISPVVEAVGLWNAALSRSTLEERQIHSLGSGYGVPASTFCPRQLRLSQAILQTPAVFPKREPTPKYPIDYRPNDLQKHQQIPMSTPISPKPIIPEKIKRSSSPPPTCYCVNTDQGKEPLPQWLLAFFHPHKSFVFKILAITPLFPRFYKRIVRKIFIRKVI